MDNLWVQFFGVRGHIWEPKGRVLGHRLSMFR